MKIRLQPVVCVIFALLLVLSIGCQSESNRSTIAGVVLAPNGVDPVPGADVYLLSVDAPPGDAFLQSPSMAMAYTTSGADGSFLVESPLLGEVRVVIVKGFFRSIVEAEASGTPTMLSGESTTLPSVTDSISGSFAPRFGVISGWYDNMEDVLAKFGMGSVDETGALVLGTEAFSFIRGTVERWHVDHYDLLPESYPTADAVLTSLSSMRQMDVLVVNCGNAYEYLLSDSGVVSNIREFVSGGGRLYVTDWSFDFIEQAFPDFLRALGGPDPSTGPEPVDAGEMGFEGGTCRATVLDAGLSSWLQGLGSLNEDGTVDVGDWLVDWNVMDYPHTGPSGAAVKLWVEGPVSWYAASVSVDPGPGGGGVKPLTASFPYGKGKVIYTSYHTACTQRPGFWPQERILEYLLLESAS